MPFQAQRLNLATKFIFRLNFKWSRKLTLKILHLSACQHPGAQALPVFMGCPIHITSGLVSVWTHTTVTMLFSDAAVISEQCFYHRACGHGSMKLFITYYLLININKSRMCLHKTVNFFDRKREPTWLQMAFYWEHLSIVFWGEYVQPYINWGCSWLCTGNWARSIKELKIIGYCGARRAAVLPEELEALAVCGADKWWPGSGWMGITAGLVWGGAGLGKQPSNVFIVLYSARACACWTKEVKGRRERDGYTGMGFRMHLLGKG